MSAKNNKMSPSQVIAVIKMAKVTRPPGIASMETMMRLTYDVKEQGCVAPHYHTT